MTFTVIFVRFLASELWNAYFSMYGLYRKQEVDQALSYVIWTSNIMNCTHAPFILKFQKFTPGPCLVHKNTAK